MLVLDCEPAPTARTAAGKQALLVVLSTLSSDYIHASSYKELRKHIDIVAWHFLHDACNIST